MNRKHLVFNFFFLQPSQSNSDKTWTIDNGMNDNACPAIFSSLDNIGLNKQHRYQRH